MLSLKIIFSTIMGIIKRRYNHFTISVTALKTMDTYTKKNGQ